jgi:putative transposase
MKRVIRIGSKRKSRVTAQEKALAHDGNARVALIQALIPIGLEAVAEELEREVERLVGAKHSRSGGLPGHYRWGGQAGSVYLADEKVKTRVPRVRNVLENKEVPLESYRLLQKPRNGGEGVMRKVLYGLSCRKYEQCAEAVPGALGLSSSSISRRFIQVSGNKFKELMERDLSGYDFVALFLDGKSFAEDEMILALGVTLEGEKVVLGLIQAGTENETVIKAFLNELLGRGLNIEEGILCVIDGAKGFHSAIRKVFADRALVQRCQWHKRENVVAYLPKSHQSSWRRKLQQAYEKPTYEEAKAAVQRLKLELKLLNVSALSSLEEGLEETLTLHRLGLFADLGASFKTANCIESIMAQVGQYTDKVDYWRNSSQKHRWVATALLEIEARLRRVKGYRKLWKLREALKQHTHVLREAA